MIYFAQMRFPKPEFKDYIEPVLELEERIPDTTLLRVLILAVMLLLTGLALYRWRSRKRLQLLAVANLLIFGFLFKACPCPVGMYQNLAAAFFQGQPVPLGLVLLFILPLAVALYWGRLFCMGGCPMGALQELLHLKTIHVPLWLDRLLRQIPLLILLVFTVIAGSGGTYYFCRIDPFYGLFSFSTSAKLWGIALFWLVIGLFISRPVCRYLCPYGVLLRFFSLLSPRKVEITTGDCVRCRLCEQGCPNGAVIEPEPLKSLEDHEVGRRRLGRLLAWTPWVILLCAVAGFWLADPVAQTHKEIVLLRDLERGNATKAVETFAASGRPLAELQQSAAKAKRIIRNGMTISGAIFGAVLMLELLVLSRRRFSNSAYQVDRGLCFACGRCYEICPVEKQFLNNEKTRKDTKN
ncbi:MAG: 4Fe-4S binding protein [Lentisphaerae bacterium]|nr:4Fe-4S binding protein [Lentisphaerota bacterium]